MYTVAKETADLIREKQLIGDRIRELREREGWNQTEAANKIPTSQQLFSEWENGNKVPGGLNLKRLSQLFKVSTDYILRVVEDEQGKHPSRQRPDLIEKLEKAIGENNLSEMMEIIARLRQEKD